MNKNFAALVSFLIIESTCPGQEIPALPDFPAAPVASSVSVAPVYESVATAPIPNSSGLSALGDAPFIGQIKGVWPPTFGSSSANTEGALARATAVTPSDLSQPANPQLPPLPDLSSEPPAPAIQPAPVVAINESSPVEPGAPATPSLPATPVALAAPVAPATPAPSPVPVAAVPVPAAPASPAEQMAPTAPAVAQQVKMAPRKTSAPKVALAVDINSQICPLKIRQTHPGEHPMGPLLEWAIAGKKIYLSKIQDYTCTMVKKERLNKTVEPNQIFMKVREQPFSVYMRFEEPKARCGQEVLFVDGQNNGKLLGHDVGIKKYLGSVWLVPDGTIAMMGQRYPITDSGIANLVKKMIETMQADMRYGECDVQFTLDGPQVEGRPCVRIDVVHPVKRDCFRFHKAEIFLDKQLGIPLRYSAYLWPENKGDAPILDEEYSFSNLKFNVGLTDKDFDRENKEYKF